jgi:hypothetical protein
MPFDVLADLLGSYFQGIRKYGGESGILEGRLLQFSRVQ